MDAEQKTQEYVTRPAEFLSRNRLEHLANYDRDDVNDFNETLDCKINSKKTQHKEWRKVTKKNTYKNTMYQRNKSINKRNKDRSISNIFIRTDIKNALINTIVEDSMVHIVLGDKIKKSLKNKHHIAVRSFGVAKPQWM